MKKHARKYPVKMTFAILTLCSLLVAGCEFHGTYPDGTMVVVDGPAPVVVTSPPASTQLLGTIAVTAYAPVALGSSTDTVSTLVTVRSGSAFGPLVLQPETFTFDADGLLSLDIVDLPYGYYDIELVGLDSMGSNVSYAAGGLTLNEPIESLSVTLEQNQFSSDVYLDINEPTWDPLINPVHTLDYILWDRDSITGELTFVEQATGVFYDGISMPMIADLSFGQYRLDIQGYDIFGLQTVAYVGDFEHADVDTLVSINFWYSW